MSEQISVYQQKEFDNEVKHVSQGNESLANTVSMRTNVTGVAYDFKRMGEGMAQQKAYAADITPLDIANAKQTAYLYPWVAGDYSDIFSQAEVAFEEKTELAKVIEKAMRRRKDQILINTMNGGTYANTDGEDPDIGMYYDASTANFKMICIHKIMEHFQNLECEEKLHLAVEPGAIQSMLRETQASSRDYSDMQALMAGTLKEKFFMGLFWHVVGKRKEGGLPTVSTQRYAYAWAESAIGYAESIPVSTEINYVPVKMAWLVAAKFKAGAVIRENRQIFETRYTATAA